jgi:hypothetical protein
MVLIPTTKDLNSSVVVVRPILTSFSLQTTLTSLLKEVIPAGTAISSSILRIRYQSVGLRSEFAVSLV